MKPLFEHRHYVWMTTWLKDLNMPPAATLALAENMASALERTNPNFDRRRFLCAAEGYPITNRDRQ